MRFKYCLIFSNSKHHSFVCLSIMRDNIDDLNYTFTSLTKKSFVEENREQARN